MRLVVLACLLFACAGSGVGADDDTGLVVPTATPIPTPNPTPGPLPGVSALDMSGRLLSSAPLFTRVQSFNEGQTVQVGVDPAAVPGLDGTCALFVVVDRSAAGWVADSTLVDVRGPSQSITLSPAGLAGNLIPVDGSGSLSGGVVGMGYDLVLDCDGDGSLSSGDVIDGSDGAGFFILPDLTLGGPHAVTEVDNDAGTWRRQIISYPSDVASMGELPLVMIAHGFGHELTYYQHLSQHLASHGYVVSSFRNDVGDGDGPGTNTAAATLLDNTAYMLTETASLQGGDLDGHLDADRIVWIGHSTGGECVVRAYTQLHDGDFTSTAFDADSISLVSSMAPVAWLARGLSHPHDVNYHLITGAADRDTGNYPEEGYTQNMALFERASGSRHLTYLHGAGHGDLHDGDQNWLDQPDPAGPDLIGPTGAHPVVLSTHLALIEFYTQGNEAMRDLFERNPTEFRPLGIAPNVVYSAEYRPALSEGHRVVDDFQTAPELELSSSGGAVIGDVGGWSETRMFDQDWSYDWTGSQPANGMTRNAKPADDARGLFFEWAPGSEAFLAFGLIDAHQDLSDVSHVAFRVAQGTRHPYTVGLAGDLSFTVTLVDGSGAEASVEFGAYGAVNQPYQRTGSGSGAGWANEFVSLRIPVDDFAGIDRSDVSTIRFDVGSGFGSGQGRVALDDLHLVVD